jgi:hypothetical protein
MCYQPFHLYIFFPCMLYIYLFKFRFKLFLIWKIPSALNCIALHGRIFIYLFISLVGCFVYYENHKGGGGRGGGQLQVTLFRMQCQPSCCFQIEVGLTSGKSILHLSFTTYKL